MLLRYPGGKNRKSIQAKLLSKAPSSYLEYREPFCGGAGLFWKINPLITRWINDKDEDLISLYLALKQRPADFIASCRSIPPTRVGDLLMAPKNGKKIYNARLGEKFKELLNDPNADRALKYFFINRTVWGGRVNYTIPSRLYYSNPSGWNITTRKGVLEKAADLLKDTQITCGDYSDVLKAEGKDVFCYLDPPYYVNTNLPKTSQLYRHNFTKQDHIDLCNEVLKCQHKILISYDDDNEGFIRSLYGSLNIYEENWTYSGSSSATGQSKKKKIGRELLITNY